MQVSYEHTGESARIAIHNRGSGIDLASILANATESDLSALVEYAQQESHIRAKTSVNAESAEKDSSSTRSSAANLTKIVAILSSLAPEELAEILKRLQH